jgi:hypothetical protein
MAGRCPDRRVIVGKSVGRPTYGSHGEHRARRGDDMGLADTPIRLVGSWQCHTRFNHHTSVTRPGTAHRAACGSAAVASRLHHTTGSRSGPHPIPRSNQPAVRIILHIEYVHVRNIKDRIGSGAPARTRTTHRVGHCRVLYGTEAWSPLILKVPTPLLAINTPQLDMLRPPSIPKTQSSPPASGGRLIRCVLRSGPAD